jgi:hypothetical protein
MATAVRIKPQSHKALKQISQVTGRPMQEELERAIEERRRRVYLDGLASDFAALKKDPKAWQDMKKEDELWDKTSNDGLAGH